MIGGQREMLELLRKLGYAKFQIIDQTAVPQSSFDLAGLLRLLVVVECCCMVYSTAQCWIN
jgi:hypothetical protein